MNGKELLGQKIKALRNNKKLTQEKFAELVDISIRQVVKIETGKCYPSTETLIKIAKIFEVTLDILLDNDHYDTPDVLRAKLHERVDSLDDKRLRYLYIVTSNFD